MQHRVGGLRCRRNILVVKLDYIGDWVLCTPFLEQLRRRAPEARITAVVLDQVYPLAAACPYVDRVVAVQQAGGNVRFMAADTMTVSAFLADYCTGRFDLAIVPRWDADFANAGQIAAASGAPHVVGFSEYCTARKRNVCAGSDRFYTHFVRCREPMHEAEQNLQLFQALDEQYAPAGRARVDTLEIDDSAVASFLRRSLGNEAGPFLAIAPFASEAKRTLPGAWLLPLCARLARSYDLKLVIIGSRDDAVIADGFAGQLGPGAVSACGRLTLRQSAALIRRCTALIGMDSGPAHIAAALDRPVAVLSCHPVDGDPGHENSPRRFAPWGDPQRTLVLQPQQAMPPCTTACRAPEPHCILSLTANQLVQRLGPFVHAQLTRGPANRTIRH